jgi:phage portal protein BeeE
LCRVFRVFPQMIGYADKTSTYASAEQFFIAHVVHSLGPWIERWEQALARDLMSDDDIAAGYMPKLNVAGLLRGDAKSRADYYASGIVNGWLTRNESRKLEDLGPARGATLNMGSRPTPLLQPRAQANQRTRSKVVGREAGRARPVCSQRCSRQGTCRPGR